MVRVPQDRTSKPVNRWLIGAELQAADPGLSPPLLQIRGKQFERSTMAAALRKSTIGFIGLGRMGNEMARNLFTKQPSGAAFVVCDANLTAAEAFAQRIRSLHPQASIQVATSPAEYVQNFCCFPRSVRPPIPTPPVTWSCLATIVLSVPHKPSSPFCHQRHRSTRSTPSRVVSWRHYASSARQTLSAPCASIRLRLMWNLRVR